MGFFGVRIRDERKLFDRILRQMRALDRTNIEAGYFEGRDHPSGQPSANLAAIHEWGAPSAHIPSRPTIRPAFDEKREENIRELQNGLFNAVVTAQPAGSIMRKFGAARAKDIQLKITSNVPPPLKAATILAKGSTKTLIDTGAMRAAVSHRIVKAGS